MRSALRNGWGAEMAHASLAALVLLNAREAGQRDGLRARISGLVANAANGIVGGASLGDEFLTGSAHGTVLAGQVLFDFMLFASNFTPAVEQGLAEFTGVAADAIAPAASAVIVGHQRHQAEGKEKLFWVMPWRRCAHLTTTHAQDYWHDVHGKLVTRRDSRNGYRQLHADHAESARLARKLGIGQADYDGSVVTHCPSVEWMQAAVASDFVRDVALIDEQRFIDHRRSTFQAFEPL